MVIDKKTRCLQIWQVLIACAENRQIIRYSQLADSVGLTNIGPGIGAYLKRIYAYTERNSLPDLTVLAVNKETGLPTVYTGDPNAKREKVYDKNWFKLPPPTREDFVSD